MGVVVADSKKEACYILKPNDALQVTSITSPCSQIALCVNSA